MDADERDRWRQELIRRQRNIVFPDTVRNEGSFLRGIVQNRFRLNSVQRIGAGILGMVFLFTASLVVAQVVGEITGERPLGWTPASVALGLMSLLTYAVAFKLLFVAIFPGKPDSQKRD